MPTSGGILGKRHEHKAMPRPEQPDGALEAGSVAPTAVGAGPDQAVALALLVVEEVGEDRGGEARIVELEAQIIAALVGALGPGGADFDPADIDAVAGAVLAGAGGFGAIRAFLAWTERVTT
jgi:hypothetical protein